MNQENFEFVEELDTKEGRHFIYKAVNFFVVRSIEKAKKSPFKLIEKEHAKNYLRKISLHITGVVNQTWNFAIY